jgi:ActR/RegA family two-component response regulator
MTLKNKRVLIVEDEYFIAIDLAGEVAAAGAKVVGSASSVDTALDIIASTELDGATVDLKLMEQRSFVVADALAARHIPFVFATAMTHRDAPARFANVPWLEKPSTARAVCRALESVMRPALNEC